MMSSGQPVEVKQKEGGKGIKTEIKQEKVETMIDPAGSPIALMSPSCGPKRKRTRIFKPDELGQKLMPILERLYRQRPEVGPFMEPIDPVLLGVPDYFDIVKKPMDLSLIKRKLEIGQYQDPWEYVDDIWLMLDNAFLYNRTTSRVYRYCMKLAIFEQEIDPVMQSMGYCYESIKYSTRYSICIIYFIIYKNIH